MTTTLPQGIAALVDKASEPEFAAWRRNIVRLGGCTNPIHLVGGAAVFDIMRRAYDAGQAPGSRAVLYAAAPGLTATALEGEWL